MSIKQFKETLPIFGLGENIAFCEAMGLSKVFKAYAEECSREDILDGGVGFNDNSGYVYIALENGITICSMLGRDVEYLVTDMEDGEEFFFDSYERAEKFRETL
jgi:hypothetical protein